VPASNWPYGNALAWCTAFLCAALPSYTVPLSAQTEVGVDLGLFSSYVWRGLTRTNKLVAQPAAYVSVPVGKVSVTLGGWSNTDLGKYDDPADDISESGGSSSLNFAELEPYAEVSFPVGKTTLTGGVMGYLFPNSATAPNAFGLMTSDANTVEIYGKVGFDAPLSPELSVYYDVDKVKGAYIEGTISYSAAASENVSVDLGALAGFNAGRGTPDDPLSDERSNYNDDGFTHLDLSAGVPFTVGMISVTPALHLVVNGDERTKVTSPTELDKDVKLWGGVSLSWSKAMGAGPEDDDGS
jgi:Bacterial protein of unknown function (Gcw_chp)